MNNPALFIYRPIPKYFCDMATESLCMHVLVDSLPVIQQHLNYFKLGPYFICMF